MTWHPDGVTTVSTPILASTWTPLVVDAAVANRVLVLSDDAPASRLNVRATGEADNLETASTADGNGCGSAIGAAVYGAVMVCPCDAAGSIDQHSVLAGSHPVRLLGSLDATDDGQVLVNDAALTAGFVPYQITSLAGQYGCALIKIVRTLGTGSDVVGARPSGLVGTWNSYRRTHQWAAEIAATVHGAYMLVPTDADGYIDLITDDITAKWTVTVVKTINDWQASAVEIWTGVSGVDTYVTRASSLAGRSFVYLIGSTPDTGAQRLYASGRNPDNAADYRYAAAGAGVARGQIDYYKDDQTAVPICADTDASGDVDLAVYVQTGIDFTWDLLGYVDSNLPPVIGTPSPTGTLIAPDATVSFVITDDTATDPDTINVTIAGPAGRWSEQAIINGIFNTAKGFDGTITANGSNGYDVAITTHPLFMVAVGTGGLYDGGGLPAGTWTVTVDVSDLEGAPAIQYEWSFEIAVARMLFPVSQTRPEGVTGQLPREIGCVIRDTYGIDVDELVFTIKPPIGPPLVAMVGGVFQTGWGGTVSADDPKVVDLSFTRWPSTLKNGALHTFSVSGWTLTGLEF